MEDKKFRIVLAVIAAIIVIPVMNSLYGLIPTAITALLVAAAIVFLFVTAFRNTDDESVDEFEPELASDIKRVLIKAKGKNYIVAAGSDFSIENNDQDGIMSYVENETWCIEDDGEKCNAPVEICLPENAGLDEFAIIAESGHVVAKLDMAGSVYIRVEDGSVDLSGIHTDELTADAGKGSIKLAASVGKEVKVVCGIGTVRAELLNSDKYFNSNVTCGVGTVKVGSELFGSERRVGYIDNGSENNLDISCGLGSVEISFGEAQEI